MEPPLCVVSSWLIKRVYTILISNTISGSSNLDICFYYCWILTLILHLKVLFNLLLLLLFVIYIVHLPVVQPRSCLVIYYFDIPALGIRHQSFDLVTFLEPNQQKSLTLTSSIRTHDDDYSTNSLGRTKLTNTKDSLKNQINKIIPIDNPPKNSFNYRGILGKKV